MIKLVDVFYQRFVFIHAVKPGFPASDAEIQSTSWHLLALARVGRTVDKRPLMARRSP